MICKHCNYDCRSIRDIVLLEETGITKMICGFCGGNH
jgi:hypothetical protein